MEIYHRHLGVMSNGVPKSHLITVQHKDSYAKKYHTLAIGKIKKSVEKEIKQEKKQSPNVKKNVSDGVHIEDGFLYVNVAELPLTIKGVRIKIIRKEGKLRRTIGVEFHK